MSDRALVVEFIGLPGGGKTTIVDGVEAALCGQQKAVERRELAWRSEPQGANRLLTKMSAKIAIFRYCFSNPWRLCVLIATGLRAGGKPSRVVRRTVKVAAYCVIMADVRRTALGRGVECLIYDQGVCQAIWAIFSRARPPSENELARIARLFADDLPDVVLIVQTPPAEALRRVQRRGTHAAEFADLATSEVSRLYHSHAEFFTSTAVHVLSQLGCEIFPIDGSRSESEAIAGAVSRLNSSLVR